jgi:hypothetical protein
MNPISFYDEIPFFDDKRNMQICSSRRFYIKERGINNV